MPKMTKKQARDYMRRYAALGRFKVKELRATPLEVKFGQLGALFSSAKAMGWEEALGAEDAIAHARWSRLQRAYGAR